MKTKNKDSGDKAVICGNVIANKEVSNIKYEDVGFLTKVRPKNLLMSPSDAIMLADLPNKEYASNIDPHSSEYVSALRRLVDNYVFLIGQIL